MLAKLKNLPKAVDRTFAAATLRRAAEVASGYQIVLQHEDGEYYGRGLEMPYVMNDGRTPDACVSATRSARERPGWRACAASSRSRSASR